MSTHHKRPRNAQQNVLYLTKGRKLDETLRHQTPRVESFMRNLERYIKMVGIPLTEWMN